MGLISPQQVSDGTTADSSDINTPINTIANEFNGNIDNANIKTAAAIDGSKLAAASVTNTQLATAVSPVTRTDDRGIDWVASGCVWTGDSYGGSLNASMTAGVVCVDGIRATVSAVTARAFTASKDTYIDISSAGAITYTEVANNAASPALSAGNVRVAIIQSGATITAAGAVNQGQKDKVLPIASSVPYCVTDSLGNRICQRNPHGGVIGYRQRITNITATAEVAITECSMPIIIPPNRSVKLTIWTSRLSNDTAGNGALMGIWDGTIGVGYRVGGASFDGSAVNNAGVPVCSSTIVENTTAAALSKTYNASIARNTAGTATLLFTATTGLYAYIMAELV